MNEQLKESKESHGRCIFLNNKKDEKEKKDILKEPVLFSGAVNENDVNLSMSIATATTGEEFIKRVM